MAFYFSGLNVDFFFSNVRTTAMIHFDIPQSEVQYLTHKYMYMYVNYRYLVASIHSDFY